MGRLPATMHTTITVVDHLRRSDCPADARCQALNLLLTLAAVECHASVSQPAAVPPALLRDLVIITGRLAGRTWLEDNVDRTAAFTALQFMAEPPPLAELDQILARVLWGRFGAALAGGGSPKRRSPLRPDAPVAGQAPQALSVSSQVRAPGAGGLGDPADGGLAPKPGT